MNKFYNYFLCSLCCLTLSATSVFAQDDEEESSGLVSLNENLLMETYWRYTGTIDLNTGEEIHNPESSYEYFLYFKFDFSYQQYLNGDKTKGAWLFNEKTKEIYYDFRNIRWWKINQLVGGKLKLEFEIDGKGPFVYVFQQVEENATPFRRDKNILPTVKVNRKKAERNARYAERVKKKEEKKKAKKAARTEKVLAKINQSRGEVQVPIEIQLIGGGYYGGIDPVLKDYTVIKSNGNLTKEFQSKQKGLIKTQRKVSRTDLESLAKFIESKDFFEYDKTYDCTSGTCQKRKKEKPVPVPLRISVRYGNKYHIVTVTVWGKDDRSSKYVDYPSDLDLIVTNIQKLVGI